MPALRSGGTAGTARSRPGVLPAGLDSGAHRRVSGGNHKSAALGSPVHRQRTLTDQPFSKRKPMRTPLLLLAVAAFTSVADAQTVTPLVFVRHGVGATRVEWLSNNDIRVQRALPIQEVFKGDSACFQIEHGNPFLYTYSIATKAEKPQNEEVVTKLASAVAGLSGLTRSA